MKVLFSSKAWIFLLNEPQLASQDVLCFLGKGKVFPVLD
jgi:hypothetical protein